MIQAGGDAQEVRNPGANQRLINGSQEYEFLALLVLHTYIYVHVLQKNIPKHTHNDDTSPNNLVE